MKHHANGTAPPKANPRLAAALDYARRGLHVVVLHDRAKKPRHNDWVNLASTDADTVRGWWAAWPGSNVGVTLGSRSGVVAIDVDTEEGRRLLVDMAAGDLPDTWEMTTGKGSRLLFRIPEGVEFEPRQKPISVSGPPDPKTGRPTRVEILRFQGKGGQCVMPPSVHPDGPVYRWVEGRSPADLDAAPMPAWLVVAMSHPPERVLEWADPPPRSLASGDAPGADFNRRGSWEDLLRGQLAKPAGGRGGVQYWTRPDKAEGVSATLGYYKARDGTPALYVFSGSWPGLDGGRCYDLFGYFARVHHNGDFKAAARDLAAQGFGAPPQPSKRRPDPRPAGSAAPSGAPAAPVAGAAELAPGVTITPEVAGSGKRRLKLTVRVGEQVRDIHKVDPEDGADRAKYAKRLCALLPDAKLDPARVADLVMGYAAVPPAPAAAPPVTAAAEVDVSRVVRPELFLTRDVCGLTVAVNLPADGRPVPRWLTYLRWADGRREVGGVPGQIALPDGSALYVAPDPGEPPGLIAPPAWSGDSRRAWLGGAPPPDPAAVFAAVCGQVARFLHFDPAVAAGTGATIALWVVLTYAYTAWEAVPYLHVGGTMMAGKSRLLQVLRRLVFRPVSTSNVTAAAMFRTLHSLGGTVLYDEAERLRLPTPDVQELQSVLLAGYQRGGSVSRLEPVGDTFRTVWFDVYGPKAVACIKGLPATLASRCIPIVMQRAGEDSPKPKLRLDEDPAAWEAARDGLHRLALEYGAEWARLAADSGVVPAGIAGRHYELWQPLLALAGWFEGRGCGNLLGLVRAHALASVAAAKDDGQDEADEALLELLAEAVRDCQQPTSAELLKAARDRDEETFKKWAPATVTARLKNYGIVTPKKSGGGRRYRNVTPAQLREIEKRYGLDLGFGDPASPSP